MKTFFLNLIKFFNIINYTWFILLIKNNFFYFNFVFLHFYSRYITIENIWHFFDVFMTSACYIIPFYYFWPKTFDEIQTLIKIGFKCWYLGCFLFLIYDFCLCLLYIFTWNYLFWHLIYQILISAVWTATLVWLCYMFEYHPTLWLERWDDYFLSGNSTTASKELILTKENTVNIQNIKKSTAYRGGIITKFLFFLFFSFIFGFFLLCIIVIIIISW